MILKCLHSAPRKSWRTELKADLESIYVVCSVHDQASDSVFEMVPLEQQGGLESAGFDDVDGAAARSLSTRKTPQPIDPFSRGRRAQTVR